MDLRLPRIFWPIWVLALSACGDEKPLGPSGPAGGDGGPVVDGGADLDGGGDGGSGFVCDVVPPASCPEPAVTYATVEPIILQRCVPCHDGRTEQWPLTEYGDVVDWYDQIRAMMLDCSMPPRDSGMPMPSEEREHILTWIRCGYPK